MDVRKVKKYKWHILGALGVGMMYMVSKKEKEAEKSVAGQNGDQNQPVYEQIGQIMQPPTFGWW